LVPISRLAVVLALSACIGCGAPSDAPDEYLEDAAAIAHPVKERRLTTVTLAADAETRLGIKTTPVERRPVHSTRTIGGEVVVPVSLAGGGVVVTTASAPSASSTAEALLAAAAEVERARIARDAAARTRERAERMLRDGTGSAKAVEEARAQLGLAAAALQAAETRRDMLRGATVNVPKSLWVRVPVYVGELEDIATGRQARVHMLGDESTPGSPARPVAGPPSANADAATVDLFYELLDGSGLRPAEKVAITLERRSEEETLVVPWSAIVHDIHGGEWLYERTGSHTFARRRVQVAGVNDDEALLASGPRAGAEIVADGAAELFGVEFGSTE
jgi:hypothetical protein